VSDKAEREHAEKVVSEIGYLDENGWVSIKEERLVAIIARERAAARKEALLEAAGRFDEMPGRDEWYPGDVRDWLCALATGGEK